MNLSIIIPSKDRKFILDESLALAYSAIKNLDAEILVINDSKTASILIEPYYYNKVRVVDNPKSGVASARNLGASLAKADLLLFLDDDMWIADENVRTTLRLHEQYQQCCINLNWVYPPELDGEIRKTQFGRYLHHYGFATLKGWCTGLAWDDHKLFMIDGITSQYLSIKKDDFLKVGGYNENFPHAGAEDHDFGKRLRKAGIQPYIYPISTVYHNEADRMDVKAWLARKKRGGETRKVAAELGYKEIALSYGVFKSKTYNLLSISKPALYKLLNAIPNRQMFDPVYFKILNILLGTASYEGYTKS